MKSYNSKVKSHKVSQVFCEAECIGNQFKNPRQQTLDKAKNI